MKPLSRSLLVIVAAISTVAVSTSVVSCGKKQANEYLEYALRAAGYNRSELEAVLDHYKDDPEKLAAARFLIENMPGHESYEGSEIDKYYDMALKLLQSDLSPVEQRDSLLHISDNSFQGVQFHTITDLRTIKADYLIYSIDQAFEQWKERPWTRHLTFDEFCEWILPYKAVEYQPLDYWRDTLLQAFQPYVDSMVQDDDQYGTVFYTVDAVRNGILQKVKPTGLFNRSGYPLLRADLLLRQTFGRCEDYVNLAVLTYRSLGLPAVIDETPFWGRYRAGHSWYVILNDRGEELRSEWDVGSVPGTAFFQDKRIPKVYRRTYAINRERAYYKIHSEHKYPFDLCVRDVTDRYFRTSDIEIDLFDRVRLAEDWAYIATFTGIGRDWSVVDYGAVKDGKAMFTNMGRNVLYLALGYDGNMLVPVSEPFILHTDGSLQFIHNDWRHLREVTVRRKYFQSNNVARMRNRIMGAAIQVSDSPDFRNAETLFTVDTLFLPDKIQLDSKRPYRYWRYLSPNGSYGSIAELAFFEADSTKLEGTPISNSHDRTLAEKAFDEDWLTNYETDSEDGNWIGMDMKRPVKVSSVRIVPRGDDNDIHPGDLYELKYWDGRLAWVSRGIKMAEGNTLFFDSIPQGALIWVSDKTRGWDERPFLMDSEDNVEWW